MDNNAIVVYKFSHYGSVEYERRFCRFKHMPPTEEEVKYMEEIIERNNYYTYVEIFNIIPLTEEG